MNSIQSKVCDLFGVRYPIIQGGMIWCSGWELASAVSNSGGLGIIGSGSMKPEILEMHIRKTRNATNHPFAVNVPLIYPYAKEIMEIIVREQVKIVFTSAGNPKTWTPYLRKNGIKVAHVVASSKFAIKCEEAGVNAVVAEGFEAGGHNGREETTTFTLIPEVKKAISIPLIAAGGIATGRGLLAAMVLGADAAQLGSVFAASSESSAHISFKQKILESKEGDTRLAIKKLIPVRLLKNEFCNQIEDAADTGANREELQKILNQGRAKKGMFDGDLVEGELEIGQVSSMIKEILTVKEIIKSIVYEFDLAKKQIL